MPRHLPSGFAALRDVPTQRESIGGWCRTNSRSATLGQPQDGVRQLPERPLSGLAARSAMTEQWFCISAGEQRGPVSAATLRQLVSAGQLGPSDLVWHQGLPEWVAASKIKGLFPEASAEPPEPPPVAVSASSRSQTTNGSKTEGLILTRSKLTSLGKQFQVRRFQRPEWQPVGQVERR